MVLKNFESALVSQFRVFPCQFFRVFSAVTRMSQKYDFQLEIGANPDFPSSASPSQSLADYDATF
jgi:hypothetical protein